MMDGYISKRAAHRLIDNREYDLSNPIQKDLFHNAVNNLPSADVQHWIPCSEGLPEEDGIYAILVSGVDGDLCLFVRRFVSGIWSSILRQQDVKAWFEVPISEPPWWNEKDMVNV